MCYSSINDGKWILTEQNGGSISPVVGRERTEVAAVPRVVESIARVALVATDRQLVLVLLAVQLESRVLGIPVVKQHRTSHDDRVTRADERHKLISNDTLKLASKEN